MNVVKLPEVVSDIYCQSKDLVHFQIYKANWNLWLSEVKKNWRGRQTFTSSEIERCNFWASVKNASYWCKSIRWYYFVVQIWLGGPEWGWSTKLRRNRWSSLRGKAKRFTHRRYIILRHQSKKLTSCQNFWCEFNWWFLDFKTNKYSLPLDRKLYF